MSSPGDSTDAADVILGGYAQAKGLPGVLCETVREEVQCMHQPFPILPLKPRRPLVQPEKVLQDTCMQHPWFSTTCPLKCGEQHIDQWTKQEGMSSSKGIHCMHWSCCRSVLSNAVSYGESRFC